MKRDAGALPLSRATMQLPGKSCKANSEKWLPLWMHIADTAGILERLVSKWLSPGLADYLTRELGGADLRAFCVFLGVAHDIGKATSLFVANVAGGIADLADALEKSGFPVLSLRSFTYRGKSPHALAGEAILRKLGCPAGVAAIVGAHHGKPQNCVMDEEIQLSHQGYGKNYYGDREPAWKRSWQELLQYALETAGYESVKSIPNPSMPSQVIFTGLVIMADWIASNDSAFPYIPSCEIGDADMYPARIDRGWNALKLPEPWSPDGFFMDGDGFFSRFGFLPNSVQKAVLDTMNDAAEPGLIILEAQMGVGKTEAALAATEVLAARCGCGGVYFGLPTQSTANGIYARLRPWAEAQSGEAVHGIRLAHGMAALNRDYQALFRDASGIQDDEPAAGLVVHPWFNGRKQALLADFVIGTIDQFLMSALKQKHVMLRHLGLAGKVVIIDECHAYDAYMNHYLEMALTWLGEYKVPVIILSATLPSKRRASLVAAYMANDKSQDYSAIERARSYPLLTWTDGGKLRQKAIEGDFRQKKIHIQKRSYEAVPAILRDRLSEGGSAPPGASGTGDSRVPRPVCDARQGR